MDKIRMGDLLSCRFVGIAPQGERVALAVHSMDEGKNTCQSNIHLYHDPESRSTVSGG